MSIWSDRLFLMLEQVTKSDSCEALGQALACCKMRMAYQIVWLQAISM
jgi:hypothetical protein